MKAIENLMQKRGKFDYILLETTGLADPGSSHFPNHYNSPVFTKCLFAQQLLHCSKCIMKW